MPWGPSSCSSSLMRGDLVLLAPHVPDYGDHLAIVVRHAGASCHVIVLSPWETGRVIHKGFSLQQSDCRLASTACRIGAHVKFADDKYRQAGRTGVICEHPYEGHPVVIRPSHAPYPVLSIPVRLDLVADFVQPCLPFLIEATRLVPHTETGLGDTALSLADCPNGLLSLPNHSKESLSVLPHSLSTPALLSSGSFNASARSRSALSGVGERGWRGASQSSPRFGFEGQVAQPEHSRSHLDVAIPRCNEREYGLDLNQHLQAAADAASAAAASAGALAGLTKRIPTPARNDTRKQDRWAPQRHSQTLPFQGDPWRKRRNARPIGDSPWELEQASRVVSVEALLAKEAMVIPARREESYCFSSISMCFLQ